LLSRAQVYVLEPLTEDDLLLLVDRALKRVLIDIDLDVKAKQYLVNLADGDARRLLNLLEQCAVAVRGSQQIKTNQSKTNQKEIKPLNIDFVANVLVRNRQRFDKGGDAFYDQISALHKSVRGSNPDAALYWFCRMLEGGADPAYLARRIIRMAWEDIGLADPRAIQLANDAASTYERLGSPEGELALAQTVLYLAVAAKSNAGYVAFKKAKAFVKEDQSRAVPIHLRNAPTKLMKELGYGHEYRYAHDEPHAYAAGESYWPEGLAEQHWYEPVARGLEQKIIEKLTFLHSLDEAYEKDQNTTQEEE
jgi:putative ATPase